MKARLIQVIAVLVVVAPADAADCKPEFFQRSWEGPPRLRQTGDVDILMGTEYRDRVVEAAVAELRESGVHRQLLEQYLE